jgi:hypothetical protein
VLAAGCLSLVLGCTSRQESLQGAVPNLPEDVVRALVGSDDRFEAFCKKQSAERLVQSVGLIRTAYETGSPADYERSARLLNPARRRLCDCLEREHDFHTFASRHRALMAEPPAQALERLRWRFERDSVRADTTLDPQAKIRRFEEFVAKIRTDGGLEDPSGLEGDIATLWLIDSTATPSQRYAMSQLSWRRAFEDAQRSGNFPFACQMLGALGESYGQQGASDSTLAIWGHGASIAMDYRLPEQAARFAAMFATYYTNRGRPALAHDLFLRAEDLCDEYRGSYLKLRFHLRLLDFYAKLGCWELVEQGLPITPVQLRNLRAQAPGGERAEVSDRAIREHEARLAMHMGRVAEANDLFGKLDAELSSVGRSPERVRILAEWSEGLLRNGRAAEALDTSMRAHAYCLRHSIPEWIAPQCLLEARAHLALGEAGAAGADLDNLGSIDPQSTVSVSQWIERDVLQLRLAMLRRDRAAIDRARRNAILRVQERVADTQESAEGYLLSAEYRELRLLLQDDLRNTPAQSYLAELRWREGVRPGASQAPQPARPLERLIAELEARSGPSPAAVGAMSAELAQQEAIHCLYLVDGEEVVRWTADAGGVTRHSLPISSHDLDARIRKVVAVMDTEPTTPIAPIDAATVRELHDLAVILLPPRVLSPGPRGLRRLYVSPDATLGLLPFAALSTEATTYHPLVERMDVVGLRSPLGPPQRTATGPGLVVADALLSQRMQKRHGPFPPLDGARCEALRLRELTSDVEILAGPEARKERIVASWSDAAFIVFATHVARVAGTPFASFIPLPEGTAFDSEHLDWSDIATADLSGCRLVVLSGCATGQPYVTLDTQAPGLGDAFLAAGAAAAVETAWQVPDETARAFMDEFDRRWLRDGEDPVQALNETARQHVHRAGSLQHPFYWAPYTIQVSRIDGEPPRAQGSRRGSNVSSRQLTDARRPASASPRVPRP